ncbi:MAG: transcriptional repressor [Polyangiaceae bacterium]|nr:transcriptional repressor [Polyangiaceae bacterium]
MLARLGESGLKLTPQRIAIVRELADDSSHPTAQELFDRLAPAMPTMSFATVYNTLDALARCNLIEARALAPGATRFDPNVEPHHHAVCDRCGCVADVAPRPRSTSVDASLPDGFAVRAVEQIFRGTCQRCRDADGGD